MKLWHDSWERIHQGLHESPLDFSLTRESPLVNEIISMLALPHICFIFLLLFSSIWHAGGCWYSLSWGSVCDLCLPYGLRKCVTLFESSKNLENDDWHHPEYQMMWMEKHAVDDPKEQDHMLNVFSGLLVWRKGPGYWFKWKTHCVLYCILLPFVLHFIVNWIYSEKIILC